MRAVGPLSGTLLLDYGDTRILDVMIEGLSRAEAHRSERFVGDSVGDIIRFTQTARTSVAQDRAETAQRLRNQRVDDCFPRGVARVFWLFGILLGCPQDDRTGIGPDKRAGKPTLFSGRPPPYGRTGTGDILLVHRQVLRVAVLGVGSPPVVFRSHWSLGLASYKNLGDLCYQDCRNLEPCFLGHHRR